MEETRRHAAAKDVVDKREGETAVVVSGDRRGTDDQMRLFCIPASRTNNGPGLRCHERPFDWPTLPTAEVFYDQFGEVLRKVASNGNDDGVRRVSTRPVFVDRVARHRVDRVARAENWRCQRMTIPDCGVYL